ncbi:hypothetical protein [Streptomyces sp. NPDC046197]|uniref:hypothetical protein n=1 Tax=Streptomyces sp. NPDC046197 TaxID=3154337 RepID=UPI0033CCF045
MPRCPARLVPACSLWVACLLTVTGCSGLLAGRSGASSSAAAGNPTGKAVPTGYPALTDAQARAALITQADLGEPWAPTQGTATWHDGVLKAQADVPECQRFLDSLYADELLGTPAGTHAVAGFDDGNDQAQLRYQVLADRPGDVDRALAWLKTLPQTCAQFSAATTRAGVQTVQVSELTLPSAGDARQGLRVVLVGGTADGDTATTLVLDVAAVRVGDDAITLTNGGPVDVPADSTRQAVQLGVEHLTQVHQQARTQA